MGGSQAGPTAQPCPSPTCPDSIPAPPAGCDRAGKTGGQGWALGPGGAGEGMGEEEKEKEASFNGILLSLIF